MEKYLFDLNPERLVTRSNKREIEIAGYDIDKRGQLCEDCERLADVFYNSTMALLILLQQLLFLHYAPIWKYTPTAAVAVKIRLSKKYMLI
jgi:hypothetical protein